MSHRKFEHPRCGSLGFLPKKRCSRCRGQIKRFPKDIASAPCHLTAFMGFKSGMTHVIRRVTNLHTKPKKKEESWVKEEVCEPVTVIESPPVVVIGIVGYIKTPKGMRTLNTLFTEHMSEEVRRRFYKNWFARAKRKTRTTMPKVGTIMDSTNEAELEEMKRRCSAIRVLCHTQVRKIRGIKQKKANIMEIQINGGSVPQKVDYGHSLFEKHVHVDAVFKATELIDVIGITKGKGNEGVISRWGVTRLPRKTHRGLRKVACIGAWHPSAVKWTVARAGQKGYHHRTEINKRIYRIGKARDSSHNACTGSDITGKSITPMGGFPHYGILNEDYILVKGSTPGPVRRLITLRRSIFPEPEQATEEERMRRRDVTLVFIDTSSKFGHGRFQTSDEKAREYGRLKR